jgi:acyl dehydratase
MNSPTIVSRSFSQDDLDAFGLVSGGTGHIHTDPDFAAGTPFGRTLVQGLFLLAVVEKALCEAAPTWFDLSVKFVGPVGVGDEFRVEVRVEVSDQSPAPDGVSIEAYVGDRPVLVGNATRTRE